MIGIRPVVKRSLTAVVLEIEGQSDPAVEVALAECASIACDNGYAAATRTPDR